MDNNVMVLDGYSENSPGIVPRIDPQELKALFHLLNGKPDSSLKIFPKDVKIYLKDLAVLYENMNEKLDQYDLAGREISIDIKFENNKIKTYSDWNSFFNANWEIPESIESMIIKWDFLIKLPHYDVPQRHTAVIRLASGLKAEQVFQLLLTGKIEDMDAIEQKLAPVICKIDFVNYRLAEELINIVDEWNKGLKLADNINNKLVWVRQHKMAVANAIRYITPWVFIIMATLVGNYFITKQSITYLGEITIKQFQLISIYLVVVGIIYSIGKRIAFTTGKKVLESAVEYGEIFTFEITRGDTNKEEQLKQANEKHIGRILKGITYTILINCIYGIISGYVLTLLG